MFDVKPNVIETKVRNLKKLFSMVLVAVMLGVSNVVLEEDRSLNDTRLKTEFVEVDDNEKNIQ